MIELPLRWFSRVADIPQGSVTSIWDLRFHPLYRFSSPSSFFGCGQHPRCRLLVPVKEDDLPSAFKPPPHLFGEIENGGRPPLPPQGERFIPEGSRTLAQRTDDIDPFPFQFDII